MARPGRAFQSIATLKEKDSESPKVEESQENIHRGRSVTPTQSQLSGSASLYAALNPSHNSAAASSDKKPETASALSNNKSNSGAAAKSTLLKSSSSGANATSKPAEPLPSMTTRKKITNTKDGRPTAIVTGGPNFSNKTDAKSPSSDDERVGPGVRAPSSMRNDEVGLLEISFSQSP